MSAPERAREIIDHFTQLLGKDHPMIVACAKKHVSLLVLQLQRMPNSIAVKFEIMFYGMVMDYLKAWEV